MSASLEERLEQLFELLRIPSISGDGRHGAELEQAAQWLVRLIGDATVTSVGGNPLVDGRIPASREGAPTVLAYGHYDVQPPGPEQLWKSAPFEPVVDGGCIRARGIADDKGGLYALVRGALDLAAEGALPVNVRVLSDGEEEIGGDSVVRYLEALEDELAAAVIFDSAMAGPRQPAITTSTRGIAGFQLVVRAGARELHSGTFGGAALNAVHALHRVLAAVIDLPEALRAGATPPTPEERTAFAALPDGAAVLGEAGAVPSDERAAAEFHERTTSEPSLTVHSVGAGDASVHKTSIVPEARASLSLRVAPGQDAHALLGELERLLRDACPPGATLELEPWTVAEPAHVSPEHPLVVAGAAAIERATGLRPVPMRIGGSLPIMAALARRGTPTLLSGFVTLDDNIHSPNESMPLERYRWTLDAAREVYVALGDAFTASA